MKHFHAREDMNLNEFADFGWKNLRSRLTCITNVLYMNANIFNLPRMNRNIGGRRNTVHFLFFLDSFSFSNGQDRFNSFVNLILSIRSRSPAQRFHLSRANQTTLERQIVSAPGHSYYNCNTTKTNVALPIRA